MRLIVAPQLIVPSAAGYQRHLAKPVDRSRSLAWWPSSRKDSNLPERPAPDIAVLVDFSDRFCYPVMGLPT